MDTESKQAERLIERIGKLPQKKQDAICWLINNCEFVTRLCENSTLTQTEWDEQMKKAEEKDDAYMAALLLFEKFITGREG